MGRPKKIEASATDYKRGFNAEKYDRLYPYAKKGRKEVYQAAAAKAGMSLNEFVIDALERRAKEVLGEED